MSELRVRDVEAALGRAFPIERAEAWDRGGLLAGDPSATVRGVMLALDPTVEAVRAAAAAGANVLLTHHPAFLEPPVALRPGGRGGGAVVFEALSRGVALINAHTNLDRDERAQRLIPEALGLLPERPLEVTPQPRVLVSVYVPREAADAVIEAMTAAGAGRIGDYERCSFTSAGVGSFTPPEDAHPCAGTPGEPSAADEVRIEMVCSRAQRTNVVAAAAAAHPYEEPLVVATEVLIAPNSAAMGMLSAVGAEAPLTLGGLADQAAHVFGVNPRVWGDAATVLTSVATATGSAGSLVGAALASGAQALVAGEVRYHDALDASSSGLCVIELGHDVSEWPLVTLLEGVVRDLGLDPACVTALPAQAGWWTTKP